MAINVKVRLEDDFKINMHDLPVEAATTIEVGDLISYESGYAVQFDAVTEDATFAGVSRSKSIAGNTDPIIVQMQCIVEADCTSAAYTYGQSLAANTTTNVIEDGSGANTIGWSVDDTASGDVTALKMLIDVVKLGKLFSVDA